MDNEEDLYYCALTVGVKIGRDYVKLAEFLKQYAELADMDETSEEERLHSEVGAYIIMHCSERQYERLERDTQQATDDSVLKDIHHIDFIVSSLDDLEEGDLASLSRKLRT